MSVGATVGRTTTPDPSTWIEHAVCRDSDPELFHITGAGRTSGQVAEALAVCRRCPDWVVAQCLKAEEKLPAHKSNVGQIRARRYWPAKDSTEGASE